MFNTLTHRVLRVRTPGTNEQIREPSKENAKAKDKRRMIQALKG